MKSRAIDIQLLIVFYKGELRREPNCLASKQMLAFNRGELMKIKGDVNHG